MADFDWKNLVRAVAPTVATALGTPAAGMAVKILSDSLLGKPDGTEAEIAAAVQTATPDQLLKLKQANQQFAVQMKELDLKLSQAFIDDTKDARSVHGGDPKVFKLGVTVLVTFAIGVGAVMWLMYKILVEGLKTDPSTVAVVFTMIGTVVGYLAANAQQVIGYYFGSSAGSKEKSDAMAKAVEGLGKL